MFRVSPFTISRVVLAGLAVVACGRPPETSRPATTTASPTPVASQAAAADPTPDATPAEPAAPTFDACALLTAEDVLAATGLNLVSSKPHVGETFAKGAIVAVASCTYLNELGTIANLALYTPGDSIYAGLETDAPSLKGYAPATGLGARAFFGGNSYGDGEVRILTADGRALIVTVQQGEPARWKEQVTKLATHALARLAVP